MTVMSKARHKKAIRGVGIALVMACAIGTHVYAQNIRGVCVSGCNIPPDPPPAYAPGYNPPADNGPSPQELERRRQEQQRQEEAARQRKADEAARQARYLKERDAATATMKGLPAEPAPEPKDPPPAAPAPRDVKKTASAAEPQYKPAGNALIGGVSWINGYNAYGLNPAQRTKAIEALKKQAELAGADYAMAADLSKYDFMLSIAASTNPFVDLVKRAVWEEFRNGQFAPTLQNAYNAIKGRQFEELACHSNGAMICLAALMNKDIKADRVVLYGPQITPESLKLWNDLVSQKKIRSIQIYLNQGDPIAPMAMLTPSIVMAAASSGVLAPAIAANGVAGAYATRALFNTHALEKIITAQNPNIAVKTFDCAKSYFPGPSEMLRCHDARLYKINRGGCDAKVSSGKTVAGTARAGKRDYLEPPSPC